MRRESTRYLYVYRCILRFGHRQRWRVMMMRWWYSSGDKTLHWMWPLKVCKLHASAVSYVRPKQQKRLRIMFTLYKYRIYTIHTKWVRSNWLNWFQAVLELRPSLEEYYFFFLSVATGSVYYYAHGTQSLKVYRNINDMQRVCRNRSCELGCFKFFVSIQKNSIYWNVILLGKEKNMSGRAEIYEFPSTDAALASRETSYILSPSSDIGTNRMYTNSFKIPIHFLDYKSLLCKYGVSWYDGIFL